MRFVHPTDVVAVSRPFCKIRFPDRWTPVSGTPYNASVEVATHSSVLMLHHMPGSTLRLSVNQLRNISHTERAEDSGAYLFHLIVSEMNHLGTNLDLGAKTFHMGYLQKQRLAAQPSFARSFSREAVKASN